MRARFTDAVSSTEGWAYGVGKEVVVGSTFTEDEVPEGHAQVWLASGLLEPVRTTSEVTVTQGKRERATHPKGTQRR